MLVLIRVSSCYKYRNRIQIKQRHINFPFVYILKSAKKITQNLVTILCKTFHILGKDLHFENYDIYRMMMLLHIQKALS